MLSSPLRARRQQPTLLNGISGSYEDKTSDFLCPVCFDIIEEAHITRCGHTFCFRCIARALEVHHRCPKCSVTLSGIESTIPNFLLNELISKYKSRLKAAKELGLDGGHLSPNLDGLKDLEACESSNLSLGDVNAMLQVLQQRKQRLEAESYATQNKLLFEFLKSLLRLKERQQCEIAKEVSILKKDIEEVEDILSADNAEVVKKEAVVPESFSSVHQETTQSSFSLRNQIVQVKNIWRLSLQLGNTPFCTTSNRI